MALNSCYLAAGICTMTCHKAHNVFDVVPGDVVGSVILTTAAATVQVGAFLLRTTFCKPCQQLPALCILALSRSG